MWRFFPRWKEEKNRWKRKERRKNRFCHTLHIFAYRLKWDGELRVVQAITYDEFSFHHPSGVDVFTLYRKILFLLLYYITWYLFFSPQHFIIVFSTLNKKKKELFSLMSLCLFLSISIVFYIYVTSVNASPCGQRKCDNRGRLKKKIDEQANNPKRENFFRVRLYLFFLFFSSSCYFAPFLCLFSLDLTICSFHYRFLLLVRFKCSFNICMRHFKHWKSSEDA